MPVITLKGEAHITLNVGETYTEAGATASDEKDGDLSSKISMSGTVNTSKAGIYEITYTVENSRGKVVTKTRTVTVKEKDTKPENTVKPDAKNETTGESTSKNETTGNTTANTTESTVGTEDVVNE